MFMKSDYRALPGVEPATTRNERMLFGYSNLSSNINKFKHLQLCAIGKHKRAKTQKILTAGNKKGNKKEGAKRKKPSQVRGLGGQ